MDNNLFMNINEQELVSIGLPVYNGENYIHECIKSILSQDYQNLEVCISDNASVDDTVMLVKKLAEQKALKAKELLSEKIKIQS